jgi:hypothetical protein
VAQGGGSFVIADVQEDSIQELCEKKPEIHARREFGL